MKRREFCTSSLAALAVTGFSSRARAAVPDELPVLSRTGRKLLLTRAEVGELKAGLRGSLLLRGDQGYEQARHIWNGAFDRHPAAIVRCANASDVAHAVQFVATHDLLVAVRGGGHSLPGHSVCDDGVMIDLAPMKGVQADPASKVARVEPGVLLGAMDRAAQAHGMIVPAGTVSHTGVAGLTLGGGFGRLARRFGLSIDSLIGADVVTADGRLVRADSEENADLYWALRGGGGNFGVVISFEFRMHPLAWEPVGGDLVYPFAQARSVLDAVAGYSEGASDDLWLDPVLECDARGTRQLRLTLCHCGEAPGVARDLAAIRKFGKPTLDTTGARPYVTLQSEHDDDSPHGRGYYMTGGLVQSMSPALIANAIDCIQRPGAELAKISITQHGGAIARVPSQATAFANRGASHNVVVRAAWDDPADAESRKAWQKETWKGFAPLSQAIYANLNLGDADPRTLSAYGPNLPRLMELKARYDAKNLFHLNPNIKPHALPVTGPPSPMRP